MSENNKLEDLGELTFQVAPAAVSAEQAAASRESARMFVLQGGEAAVFGRVMLDIVLPVQELLQKRGVEGAVLLTVPCHRSIAAFANEVQRAARGSQQGGIDAC